MNTAAGQDLRSMPEAVWAQVTFFAPVSQAAPSSGLPGASSWQKSVALFPVLNEPGVRTDRQWRAAHIATGTQTALFDQRYSAVLDRPVELGRMSRSDGELIQLRTEQLEFLATGIKPGFGPGAILIIHAELHGSLPSRSRENKLPVRWLASRLKDLARSPAGGAPAISQFVSKWGLTLAPASEILVATNLAVSSATVEALSADTAAGETWDALQTWTWALARATVPSDSMLRVPISPATPGRTITLPRRLAIVDRMGLAIIATEAVDHDVNIRRILSEFIPVFQAIYTDVLALGYLQLLVTEEVGNRLDALDDPIDHPREFHSIESRMRLLRNRFWRARITEWPWLDVILRCFQRENDLHEILDQISENVGELGGQMERSYQHALNLILLLLSALGFLGVAAGIFAAVAGFMAVLGTGHWGVIAGIIATSSAVVASVIAGSIYLRRSLWGDLAPYLRLRR